LKIIHIITELDVGGAELVLTNLVEELSASECRTMVICLKKRGEIADRIEQCGVTVVSLSIDRGLNVLFFMFRLRKLIKKEAPDIINTWLYHADIIGFFAARLCGIKNVIWNIRCADIDKGHFPFKTRVLVKLNSFLSRYINNVVVNSNAGKKWHVEQGYKPESWKVIPNGYDLDKWKFDGKTRIRLREALGIDEASFVIGMVARYDPLKDHRTFISAMNLVKSRYPAIKILMFGKNIDSNNKQLTDYISQYDLTDNISLLGITHNLHEYYSVFDILVSSSVTEGFPNVLAEAMACERPCVSTDVGDAALIIGNTGKIVSVSDPDTMANKVIELIMFGPEKRRELGVMARNRIQKNYSIKTMANSYKTLYDSISS